MSFNDTVPLQVLDLQRRRNELAEKKWDAERQAAHDCDCEFCTYIVDDADREYFEAEAKSIDEELQAVTVTLKRLKRYADDKGIKLLPKRKERA